jgi:hypothetical protein
MTSGPRWQRIPQIVTFPDIARFSETYGFAGNTGNVNLEGQLFRPATSTKTLYLFMHPSSTLNLLPMPAALADAGLHVLCAASRYPKNDSALIMEKVAIDLGQWISHARGALGYETVVLVGWSGGGSLSLFYQAQAERPTITHTPAGDEVDLTRAELPRADAIVFIAAHLSRAETITEWLDPSVIDEQNPDRRNREFDIYAPDCPISHLLRRSSSRASVSDSGNATGGSPHGAGRNLSACAKWAAPSMSALSSCIEPCATSAGLIRQSIPTGASQTGAISATRGRPMPLRAASLASRRCVHG